MHFEIDRAPWTDEYSVYGGYVAGRQRFVATGLTEQGHLTFREAMEGEVVEPFMRLRPEALKALLAAAGEYTESSDATVAHLKDAIAVRDRLLTLVERE